MAFKLTKTEIETQENLVAALEETGTALTATVDSFNVTMTAAWADVKQAQEKYNKIVEKAQGFIGAVHENYNTAYEDKSETWQEGDHGQAVYMWLEEWSTDLEESDLEPPEPITVSDLAGPVLEELPIEPSP